MEERLGLLVRSPTTPANRMGGVSGKTATKTRKSVDPLEGGDIYVWSMRQADVLRADKFGELDPINVADEDAPA